MQKFSDLAVARRVQRVKPSPTLAVPPAAARLREQGKDVIGLGAGEPDFDTPAHIAQAGVDAIQAAFTRYTNVEGIDDLKDAIIAKFQRDNALTYERSQILVSAAPKQTLYNLAMAVIDPGDEAIIPAPYWVSYPDMVLLATDSRHAVCRDGTGVQDHAAPAGRGHHSADAAAAAPTVPAIPPALRIRRADLRGSGKCARASGILIGTDDMYEKIYWEPEPFCSLVTAVPELYHRTVTINGVSKAYAMTGWRLGLLRGAEGNHCRDEHHPGPVDLECMQHFAEAATVALNSDQTCVAR